MSTPRINRRVFTCAAAVAAASLAAPALRAQTRPEKTKLAIAVGGKAAFYYLPLTISEQLGYFKAEGLDVEISDFAGGARALQALVGGSADVVSGAYEHTINMQSKNQHIQSVVLLGRAPQIAMGVSTKTMAGYKSLADLRGKKIAYSKNTANHGFLLRVLDKQGLLQKDISPVDVPLQNVGNVLESGTVDAATVSEETRVKYLQAHPDAVQLINGRSVTPGYGFKLAPKAAVKDAGKRAALKDFVARQARANAWVKAHTEEWIAAYYVKERKQDLETGRLVYAGSGSTTYVPVDSAVRDAQQAQADLFTKNGQLPAKVALAGQFEESVLTEFNAAVAAAQKG